MSRIKTKTIILKLGLTLIAIFCFNCTEPNKNLQVELIKPEIQKEDSIPQVNLINLKETIENKFSKIYDPKTISFNDNSQINFKEKLTFHKLNNNFKPHEASDFNTYMSKFELDSLGVVLENGLYHPTAIGKLALKAISNYKITKSEYSRKVFMDQVKWVETNFYETENYGFWYFTEPVLLYNLEAGWTSSFSQGTLLNVCLEAYRLTKEEKYAILIEKALKGFMVPVENGGFMRYWDNNELWFEEYSTKNPSRVLNGTMYGLVGVYNVYKDLNSELARKIFESGVNTIKNHLHEYDAKYTSRYSLADWKNEVSKENYHEGHVIQLLWFYKVTGEPIFKEYAKIFLENDRGAFMANREDNSIKSKFLSISANHTIDTINNGVNNLTDEIWAYGDFWSSYKKTELIIDLGEKRQNISALTLYHVNSKSKEVNFKLYLFDDDKKEWRYIQQFIVNEIKDKVTAYNKTGDYETYIEHYKIFENANARKLKLVFEASPDNIIAIRELNFVYDRSNELKYLINVMNKWL